MSSAHRYLPALSLLACGAIACASPASAAQAPSPVTSVATVSPAPQIVTSATGETRIAPDRARIEISVQTRAATAAAAAAENARKQQAVLDALKQLGFGTDQLSTTNYNLQPEMQYRENQTPRVTGYNATNSVLVEVRDLTLVGRAIDASLGAGANVISSLFFYASNTDDARRSALATAVARARADAEAVARAAGGSLGALLEIATVDSPRLPIPFNRLMRGDVGMQAAEATPIDPAEQTISAFVTARWVFVGGR